MVAREEKATRIYSNADGSKQASEPFDGWLYFTEYAATEANGLTVSTGINQEIVGEPMESVAGKGWRDIQSTGIHQ